MNITYALPKRLHRPFTCGEEAEMRELLGLTAGWAQERIAVRSQKPAAVSVKFRDRPRVMDVPGRLRGPVFGRAAR